MARTNPASPYATHAKDRRATTKLWERFQGGALPADEPRDPYERMLVEDWQRCRGRGVDPARAQAEVLSEDDFRALLERREWLLGNATKTLDRVQDVLVGVPGILILADESGTVLHVVGDPAVGARAREEVNLKEGGRWGEGDAGTNGIGTAIAKKAVVHVFASEHFCEGWHGWTCAGAPILCPFRDEVIGVVDFSTFDSEFRASAAALSYSLANNIAGDFKLQIEMERLQLLQHYSVYAARYPADAVLIYDRLGQLVRCSPEVNPEDYALTGGQLTLLAETPKEILQLSAPGSTTPIGTLLVVPRNRSPSFSLAPSPATAVYGDFVTANAGVRRVLDRVEKIAPTDLNVLLIGETGTGKELLASYVHRQSKRRDGPFVAVNCGAISKELFESRFFGYERGGFTGADPRGRKGVFEAADGGTLFLDEIGELPLDIQAALLRVLETGTFQPIGSEQKRSTDCRVVAATNRSLPDLIEQGHFRSDLYYRLSVVKAEIAPLRERPEDVPLLVERTMKRFCEKSGLPPKVVSSEAMRVLQRYPWPGNGRELRNVVEAAVVCAEDAIAPEDLPVELLEGVAGSDAAGAAPGSAEDAAWRPNLDVREHERQLIVTALRKYKKVSLAAKALGMSRSTLYRRLEALHIAHGR